MSIFDKIKSSIANKISGKTGPAYSDYSDIKQNALDTGVKDFDPLMPPPNLEAPMTPPDQPPPPAPGPMKAKDDFNPDQIPPGLDPLGLEPLPGDTSLNTDMNEPLEINTDNSNAEIIDRLAFIENQLSAIKSQTETINERLKNVDMKVGRRYR